MTKCNRCDFETRRLIKYKNEALCGMCYRKIPYAERVKAIKEETE